MKKTKKIIYRLISIISLIGFIVCTVLLLYPVISDRWNRYRDMQLINEYIEVIDKGDNSYYEDELKKAWEYNKMLYSEGRNIVTDAEYDPDAYYETLLNITGNGIMCYIEIPQIGITEPVYHYSTEVSLGEGVGHIHGSSLPTGDTSTHSILTGHRGLPSQKFFSDLDKLQIGDCFYIHILGHTLAYKVCDINVILPTDVSGLMIEEGRDLVTLVTCEPYGINSHRLLVTGERVEFDEANVKNGFVTTEKHKLVIDPAVWVFIGFIIFIVLFVLVMTIIKCIKHGNAKKNSDN
ncbi:MAG: class C sortase [Acutalibacteraceae bacterium]|nr:class C sortase [Clostridia bacterium]MEE3450857.1 class C sortase [Acutalibacteraceae bacterium]